MAQVAETFICPKGHASTEADYCSECGAKLQGAAAAGRGAAANGGGVTGQVCPDCGTLRERSDTVFCEVCGYNFATGAHGEVPPAAVSVDAPTVVAAPTAPEPNAPVQDGVAGAQRWSVVVSVDPSLRAADSPEAPAELASFTVTLQQPMNLIGRRNEARGIFPEIALDHDEAVSRRHAVLQLGSERGLLLRDIGAANGTRLNGVEVQPMVDTPLKNGDEITLGHWSRIRVEVS